MKKMVIAVAVSMIMGSFAAAEAVVWNNMEALQETRVDAVSYTPQTLPTTLLVYIYDVA